MRNPCAGFSLVEVLVALLIFALVATGLAQTLVATYTARRTAQLRMDANQLAVAEAERIRTGQPATAMTSDGPFAYDSGIEPVAPYDDLRRLRVTVQWVDRQPRQLELLTLMRAPGSDG